ncbi:MAG: hypothetical protein LUF92_11150, partial [Clostridiales bacterium]|nr:hypothetical protein [Clostridiales bacterium]
AGIDVGSCQMSKKKGYFITNRIFSDGELEMLVNVIQSADTLSDDMKNNLIEKVAGLGGAHKAKSLMPEPGPEKRKIVLELDLKLFLDVFERFLLIETLSFSEDKVVLATESMVDEKFWDWIVSFDGGAKVISPEDVVVEYRKRLVDA